MDLHGCDELGDDGADSCGLRGLTADRSENDAVTPCPQAASRRPDISYGTGTRRFSSSSKCCTTTTRASTTKDARYTET
jgi:hypothetical protein